METSGARFPVSHKQASMEIKEGGGDGNSSNLLSVNCFWEKKRGKSITLGNADRLCTSVDRTNQFIRFIQAIINLSWPQRPFCGRAPSVTFVYDSRAIGFKCCPSQQKNKLNYVPVVGSSLQN
ncbi:hypothetical protein SDJN02_07169, partial [Cucurbita argyrosperma subsp. argyrosperma]